VFPCIPEILGSPETPEILGILLILHYRLDPEHQKDPGNPEIPEGLGNPESHSILEIQQVPDFPCIPGIPGNPEPLEILVILHHHQGLEHQQAPENLEIQ